MSLDYISASAVELKQRQSLGIRLVLIPSSSRRSNRSLAPSFNIITYGSRTMATSRGSKRGRKSEHQEDLLFSSEELRASPSASPDSGKDWLIRVVTSPLPILQSLIDFAPAGWSGRTSPASFPPQAIPLPIRVHRTHQWTWDSVGKKWLLKTSTIQKSFMHSTASWPDFQHSGMGGPTECLTLNTSDWPSDGSVSSLSDILEIGDVPQQYFLSAKACRGILRRAEKRGKILPEHLALALQAVADSEPISSLEEN